MRFVWIVLFLVVAGNAIAGEAVRQDPAFRQLCHSAPSLHVCSNPPAELTAAEAKRRLEAEYERLSTDDRESSNYFLGVVFGSLGLSHHYDAYVDIRDRYVGFLLQASPKSAIDKQIRFHSFLGLIGILEKADDHGTAVSVTKKAREIITNRKSDHDWDYMGVDAMMTATTARSWFWLAQASLDVVGADAAIKMLNEGIPPSMRNSYTNQNFRASFLLTAGRYAQAEEAARSAIELFKSTQSKEKRPNWLGLMSCHLNLIVSLAKQQKSFQSELENFVEDVEIAKTVDARRLWMLSGASVLAPSAPGAAKTIFERALNLGSWDEIAKDIMLSDSAQ